MDTYLPAQADNVREKEKEDASRSRPRNQRGSRGGSMRDWKVSTSYWCKNRRCPTTYGCHTPNQQFKLKHGNEIEGEGLDESHLIKKTPGEKRTRIVKDPISALHLKFAYQPAYLLACPVVCCISPSLPFPPEPEPTPQCKCNKWPDGVGGVKDNKKGREKKKRSKICPQTPCFLSFLTLFI